ncbi:MAG: hypothetical protein AAFN27_12370 [Pseudomonadota bacterium]
MLFHLCGKALTSAIAILTLAIAATHPAQAEGGAKESDCRIERQVFAKAACLEHVFAQRDLKMTQQIDDTLSRLQAATARELLAISRIYRDSQDNWRAEISQTCRDQNQDDRIGFELCKLSTQAERQDQLDLSLARAAEELGAPETYEVDIPDSVEILVPLPEGSEFGVETRLPLEFSISTD